MVRSSTNCQLNSYCLQLSRDAMYHPAFTNRRQICCTHPPSLLRTPPACCFCGACGLCTRCCHVSFLPPCPDVWRVAVVCGAQNIGPRGWLLDLLKQTAAAQTVLIVLWFILLGALDNPVIGKQVAWSSLE